MFALGKESPTGAFDDDSNPRRAPKMTAFMAVIFGAPAGIRTPDTLLKRQVLCLLSYWGGYISFSGNDAHSIRCKPDGKPEPAEGDQRGWDGGTRTHYIGVKVRCVTITLHPIL